MDMGRFSHEALMIDPRTGWVYQTEDSGNCGLYRYIPDRFGRLVEGGRLSMLAVRRQPNLDLGVFHPMGSKFDVRWVRIDDPMASTMAPSIRAPRKVVRGSADWKARGGVTARGSSCQPTAGAWVRARCSNTTRAKRR